MDYKENILVCEVYYGLRESVGWHNFSEEQYEESDSKGNCESLI